MTITNSTAGRWADVRSAAGEVEILHSSDNLQYPDWSSVARACGDAGCVEYARADRFDGKRYEAHLVIRRPDCGLGEDVYVRAATAAGRGRLLGALMVIPPNAGAAQAIPLARLTTLSWFRPLSRAERLAPVADSRPCTDDLI